MIISYFVDTRICQIEGQRIYPYGQNAFQNSYLLGDTCEHTVLTTCSYPEKFSVNVGYSEESLSLPTIGVHYNTTTIVITVNDSMTVTTQNLDIITQSGPTTEYSNQIVVMQTSNEIIVDVRCVGVKLIVSLFVIQVTVTSRALNGNFCGLCGRLNGELVHSDHTTIADITNNTSIQHFTNSWRAVDDMLLHDIVLDKCSKKFVSYCIVSVPRIY